MSSKELSGKVAIVTGATHGIGLEIAADLAGKGAQVVLGCRNTKAAEDVADSIRQRHPGSQVVVGPSLDLLQPSTIHKFVESVDKQFPRLDILVNNAGVAFMKKTFTENGVGGIAQTNHLGPYTLTRLLERKLVASKARVVTVASVTHRTVRIKEAKEFLTEWRSGFYQHTKLANVYFGYELQRRLGPLGVTSCVADPGGVRSNIWEATPTFSKGFYRWMVDQFYSPPWDGAQSVIHAATVPWEKERKVVGGTPVMPDKDLRYYSRGLFNSPLITNLDGVNGRSVGQKVQSTIWGLSSVFLSLWDWPLRKISGGLLASATRPVPSSKYSYDEKIAADLWDASADMAKLPRKPTA